MAVLYGLLFLITATFTSTSPSPNELLPRRLFRRGTHESTEEAPDRRALQRARSDNFNPRRRNHTTMQELMKSVNRKGHSDPGPQKRFFQTKGGAGGGATIPNRN